MARPTSFDHRLVRYEDVHAIQPEDFRAFVDAANIRTHTRILDCGCGYGAVTREMLLATEAVRSRGEIDLIVDLIDESTVQISRAKRELQNWQHIDGVSLNFIEGLFPDDIPPFSTYDVIACKMVLHEVAKDQQLRFLKAAHQLLTREGRLLLWEICLSPESADFFRSVVRLKDKLSGYDTMVQRRNFLTAQELIDLFAKSAFGRVDVTREFVYRFDTRKRFMPEFGGDESRFAEWQSFVRRSGEELTPAVRTSMRYLDDGITIAFDIKKVIAIAVRTNEVPEQTAFAAAGRVPN